LVGFERIVRELLDYNEANETNFAWETITAHINWGVAPGQHSSSRRTRAGLQVLAHMTKKRPVDVNRVEFILQAEAFACLVKMECVHAEGE